MAIAGAVLLLGATFLIRADAQAPASDATQRISDRIRALEQEAAQLAGQAKTLLGELRALEIERSLRAEAARSADAAATQARQTLQETSARMAALEQQRVDQLPQLKAQLVEIYKNGPGGYARLLFDVQGVREFARATRVVAAMGALNQRRLDEHRRTLEAIGRERAALELKARELQATETAARRARATADQAVAAHTRLLEQIDTRRDLNAQFVGELQEAYDRLVAGGLPAAGAPAEPPAAVAAVPLAPFRGVLAWPAEGQVRGRFGQPDGRLGGSAVTNGLEIAAGEGASVRAVHGGTVTFADPFTGFGTLVILDHGANNYSLYGYLGALDVERGDVVASGAELGRVGLGPSGAPALYFEMRIDGRSVDPLQWLQPR